MPQNGLFSRDMAYLFFSFKILFVNLFKSFSRNLGLFKSSNCLWGGARGWVFLLLVGAK